MDPSIHTSNAESNSAALVVFGPNQIDTSRAETLVQCLDNKIKEKRYKLQKMITNNEEKRKRFEMMKSEKNQLASKLNQIEQENLLREQQLQLEQNRIRELQMNIQMLAEHNNSLQRECMNEERKFEQQKLSLIDKFEKTKKQWTDVFKPQYEQSAVYRYLKQNDVTVNQLQERKASLLHVQKTNHRDFSQRRQAYWKQLNMNGSIVSLCEIFLTRRDESMKIEQYKAKISDLENYRTQLIETKIAKMKAWERIYTQPVKRDLMDFSLQTNIDHALTMSLNEIQTDIWSQPSTPIIDTQTVSIQEENDCEIVNEKKTAASMNRFQDEPPIQIIDHRQNFKTNRADPLPGTTESIIIIASNTLKKSPESHSNENSSTKNSVRHLTTAIDDDDDEIFSRAHRKLPTVQMEKMSIQDGIPSTQAFTTNSHSDVIMTSVNEHQEYASTQAFHSSTIQASSESIEAEDFVRPILPTKGTISKESNPNKPNINVTFQLAQPRPVNRPASAISSSIQPQVTSTDVQQMLLSFSSTSITGEDNQVQPMEQEINDLPSQKQVQNQPEFSMISSIESNASIEEEYNNFNYKFAFQNQTNSDNAQQVDRGFSSPINFSNWSNLNSPLVQGTNDQFSMFLQQSNETITSESNAFTFPTFDYTGVNADEIPANETFESFFFTDSTNSN